MANICVFCASSNHVDPVYVESAEAVGRLIGQRGHNLVYGGTNLGLMGRTAQAVQANHGRVIGILLERWKDMAQGEDELIITKDIRRRKALMHERSDAFIALAGGVGTLDEIADLLVAKDIEDISKPLVLVNTSNFYRHLVSYLNDMHQYKFTTKPIDYFFNLADTPESALDYIESSLRAK